MLRIICLLLLLCVMGQAESRPERCEFGYICYSTWNIGDDIQAIAAKRFLPTQCIGIDRDFISEFSRSQKVKTIVNGWYMHTKDFYWNRSDVEAPEKSWPPSSCIDPLLISLHFTSALMKTVLSDESVAYLKKHGPVGARDYYTLRKLQEKNIPSYFSGCLTLTLDNPYTEAERENVIYAVDVDDACLNYIKSKTSCRVEVLHHESSFYGSLSQEERLHFAQNLLEKYRKAKCVITSRIHASLPCLAFETPVLLVRNSLDNRFDGIIELLNHCGSREFTSGQYPFDFDNPPSNPKNYLPIRKKLIKTVTGWVRAQSG